jgi:hypothetical protein
VRAGRPNAVDLIRLVSRLGMNVQAVIDVIDVIDVSSGGSAILRTLGSDVNPRTPPGPPSSPPISRARCAKISEHFADAFVLGISGRT